MGAPLKGIEEVIRLALTDRSKLARDLGRVNFHTPASPEFYRWIEGLMMEASLQATIHGIEELRDRDLRQEIPHISIPTRIYHGVHDQVVSFALAKEQHRLIKNSVLVPFHNNGHGLFYDEKDKLNEKLAKFLQE
jgi:pimeloyl-ACP methyl ester carboxylesterase